MKQIKLLIRENLSYKQMEKLQGIYGAFYKYRLKYKYRERQVSYGKENEDKTFYVIRCIGKSAFFQHFNIILSHLIYVDEKGYIPIVDMTDEANGYKSAEIMNTDNVWEYYFEQPAGYTLNDICRSKNIILSDIRIREINPSNEISQQKEELKHKIWHITTKYIRYNIATKDYIEKEWIKMFGMQPYEKILGIHMRGTDYKLLKPKGHFIQPDVDEFTDKARILSKKNEIGAIYLCSEDQTMINEFKNGVDAKVAYSSAYRIDKYDEKKKDIIAQLSNIAGSPYKNGLDYITDIALLSRCNYLLSGCGCLGTYIAKILKGEAFESEIIINKGVY